MESLEEEILNLKTLLGEVLVRLSELELENIGLKAKVSELESESSDLKRRLGMTSNNSHKPPSSDGLGKKPALIRSKGGTIGGQKRS